MRARVAFTLAVTALWLALFGLVALVLGYAVVEVVCIELASIVPAVLAAGLWVVDGRATPEQTAERAVSPADVQLTSQEFAAGVAVLVGEKDRRRS